MIVGRFRPWVRAAAAFAAVMTLLPQAAAAQGAGQFFKGKTINLYIGFGPGGTYDYYGRLVARFIGRHIPGEPTVVAQSMPGSGGLRAANYLFSAAPKDGTAVAVVTQTAAIEDALRSPAELHTRKPSIGTQRASDITSSCLSYWFWMRSQGEGETCSAA